jgi:hypothetical protein
MKYVIKIKQVKSSENEGMWDKLWKGEILRVRKFTWCWRCKIRNKNVRLLSKHRIQHRAGEVLQPTNNQIHVTDSTQYE